MNTFIRHFRFFVQDKVFDEFVSKFLLRMDNELILGDGCKQGVTNGPLIKLSQLQIVQDFVDDAVKKGAELHCGGKVVSELGPLFYEPTLLTGVTKEMKIFDKEIFGPVAVIHRLIHESLKKS